MPESSDRLDGFLEKVSPPDDIRRRLSENLRQAKLLRQLLRISRATPEGGGGLRVQVVARAFDLFDAFTVAIDPDAEGLRAWVEAGCPRRDEWEAMREREVSPRSGHLPGDLIADETRSGGL